MLWIKAFQSLLRFTNLPNILSITCGVFSERHAVSKCIRNFVPCKQDALRNSAKIISVSLKNFLQLSPGKFWRHIAPKNKRSFSISMNDTNATDSAEISRALNLYFSSVFTSDHGITPCFLSFDGTQPLRDVHVSEDSVLSLVLNTVRKRKFSRTA